MKVIWSFVLAGLLGACTEQAPTASKTQVVAASEPGQSVRGRWYAEDQVAKGAVVFRENCAVCHGPKAEGTGYWRQRDAQGRLPPPPLNGTAHAWHHPKSVLQRVVREGGKAFGGSMPAFADRLTGEQIDQAIAWLQAQWDDETYQKWHEIDAQSGLLQ